MNDIRVVIDPPQWGTWTGLISDDDVPSCKEIMTNLFGAAGPRWRHQLIRAQVDGYVQSFDLHAICVNNDEDAVAIRLALVDFLIRVVPANS